MTKNKTLDKFEEFNNALSGSPVSDIHSNKHLFNRVINQLKKVSGDEDEVGGISEAVSLSGHSNDVLRLNLRDGRSLMVKRARYDWSGPRFESARRATALLQQKTSVVTPEHISPPQEEDSMPVLIYWFISLPTLKNLWPDLSMGQRVDMLHSLGSVLREIHQVKVDRYGSLVDGKHTYDSISTFMEADLRERLKPAVWAKWSEASSLVERLAQMAANLPEPEEAATLVHNDLHMSNVLCNVEGEQVRCVGLLDFEAAGGGRPESDLASAIVLHDPLFAEESGRGEWLEDFNRHLLEGYGSDIDSALLQFFQIYHLLNLGFFSALNGDEWHARQVADAARQRLDSV